MSRNSKGQFMRGHKPTPEESLKISRALSEAAKRNPNYLGRIKTDYPKIFNSWRSILYTDKGKRAGCCEEWRDYRCFFNDVFPSWMPGLFLRRKDISKSWSADNFVWVTQEELGDMKAEIFLEYEGKKMTLRQWSDYLDIPYQGLRQRYHRREKTGATTEEILFQNKVNRGSKRAKDITEDGVNIRAKASKMISSYKHRDRETGLDVCDMTIEWMINNILTQPCTYCGDNKRVGCDRIDNSKGHTKDNVVPCCVECNSARNNFFSYEEMKRLGKVIAQIKADRQR